jgi:hypothetical protein
MKHKYYINKLKHLKQLKIAIIIGLSGLVALVLINVVCYYLTGRVLNSFLLGGAVFFSLISLYRTIFLIKLPVIIIDDESVSYFNVLWYNKYYWDKFELANLDPNQHTLSIGLRNGRVYDKFLLNSLSDEDVEQIIKHFETRNKL